MHILLLGSSLFLSSTIRIPLFTLLLPSVFYSLSSFFCPSPDRFYSRFLLFRFRPLCVSFACPEGSRCTVLRFIARVILNIADRTMARFNRTKRSANISPQLFIASRCLTQRNATQSRPASHSLEISFDLELNGNGPSNDSSII